MKPVLNKVHRPAVSLKLIHKWRLPPQHSRTLRTKTEVHREHILSSQSHLPTRALTKRLCKTRQRAVRLDRTQERYSRALLWVEKSLQAKLKVPREAKTPRMINSTLLPDLILPLQRGVINRGSEELLSRPLRAQGRSAKRKLSQLRRTKAPNMRGRPRSDGSFRRASTMGLCGDA